MSNKNEIKDSQTLERKMETHINLKEMVKSAENLKLESVFMEVDFAPNVGKIYMAGKLFSEADRTQRRIEYERLKLANQKYNINKKIFSPIFADVNDKSKLPSALDIFETDESELMESDVIFADLSDGDEGVMMELGMVLLTGVNIYAYISDIRIESAGEYDEIHVPFGYNQFVVGGLQKYHGGVHLSFDSALKEYIRDNRKD